MPPPRPPGRDPDRRRIKEAVYTAPAVEVATATTNRPQTFPLSPFYDPESGDVVVSSPPAFAGKITTIYDNPRLSMLFYTPDDSFLLYGRGTIEDDDLEENATYIQSLINHEPHSPKRESVTTTATILESRLGRFLYGWYALRVIVKVTPIAIEPLTSTCGSLPSWPAENIDTDEANAYDRLAFTIVDSDGWPTTRSVSDIQINGATAALDVPFDVAPGQPGCLLCHWHTPALDKLGQRLIRGRCRPADSHVIFEPASSFTMRNKTLIDRIRFVIEGKRRTRTYFAD